VRPVDQPPLVADAFKLRTAVGWEPRYTIEQTLADTLQYCRTSLSKIVQVYKVSKMRNFPRITLDPAVMGGKACIRGLRVTVGTVVGLLAAGRSREEILGAYPYLESEDIDEALAYAAWRVEEREVELVAP
jgi:uncharacterized protein (DUF433 family)